VVKTIVILYCLLYPAALSAQSDSVHQSRAKGKRLLIVTGANVAFFTGSFIALNKAWYSEYERSGFHFFNDNPEWNQMDKAGHVWSTYHIARLSTEMWQWAGLNRRSSAIAGAASGLAYQSIIEFQDAYSAAWGFSWGDVGANVVGAGMFVLQDELWKAQRVSVKMGYHPYAYPHELLNRRNQLFGSSVPERILKDYNSQTYWLSANISSFFPQSNFPKWLNVAAGYSSDGMYGGRTNSWSDAEGQAFDYTGVRRQRRVYLSPDVDLTRIPVKSKLLKSAFFVLHSLRIPLPALELANGRVSGVIR